MYTNLKKEMLKILLDDMPNLSWENRLYYLGKLKKYDVAFSTSFGYEDQAITHIIATKNLPFYVFTIDTGRLFEETHATFQSTIESYPELKITTYYPQEFSVQQLVKDQGTNGFYKSIENRRACCHIRKVEPLKNAIKGRQIWVSGLRRDQSLYRKDLPIAEYDKNLDIIKLYPLIDVSLEELDRYVKDHNIPYNILHDKGFPSVGCAPCTRAVENGQDTREGRWWWESDQKQECGLHLQDGKLVRIKRFLND